MINPVATRAEILSLPGSRRRDHRRNRLPGFSEVALACWGLLAVFVVSASLFAPSAIGLLVFVGVLLPALVMGEIPLRRVWHLVWRMRWFYLSLFLLFGWFDVSSMGAEQAWWQPTRAGLAEALLRVGALLVIAAWVVWLTTVFARPVLVQALARLLAPLAWLSLDTRGWARRLFLTLAYFENSGPKGSLSHSTFGSGVPVCPAPVESAFRPSVRWSIHDWTPKSAREWMICSLVAALAGPSRESVPTESASVGQQGPLRGGALSPLWLLPVLGVAALLATVAIPRL